MKHDKSFLYSRRPGPSSEAAPLPPAYLGVSGWNGQGDQSNQQVGQQFEILEMPLE